MQQNKMLIEEKRKLLPLLKSDYIKTDFSKVTSLLDNNLSLPRWMDVYILIYKAKLPPNIKIYDILLNQLSKSIFKFYINDGDKKYVIDVNEAMLRRYVWYLITGDKTKYYFESKFIPKKDYIKEILKFNRFSDAGIYLNHIKENSFSITPTKYSFENSNDASVLYNKFLEAYDTYKSLKLTKENFTSNIELAFNMGKDKRMIATLSNILSYFDLAYTLKDNVITLEGTGYNITNESEADKFQAKLIDAYHFFRNVVNSEDKKDIVSEVYNRKLSPAIRKQFEENVATYFNAIKNRELADWIVTISKESKYTLDIKYNEEEEIFYIGESVITSSNDAKEYYIDYMDNKKEKLAMAIYKNNIVSRIKNIWNKVRAKFIKTK